MYEVYDTQLFKVGDFYLVPLCLLFIYLVSYASFRKYRGTDIQKYFFPALNLRLFFGVVYALILQYYYGYGDTFMYYSAVQGMHSCVVNDVSSFPEIITQFNVYPTSKVYPYFFDLSKYTYVYMMNANNYAVPKFALIFSLLFSKSYLCITFCLCMYAFAGCWRLFRMFYEMYPSLKKKMAIATLFLPSILFWGGGFLKDSICIGSLGFLMYAIYSIFFRKRKIFASVLIIALMSYILISMKPYILISIFAAIGVWVMLEMRRRILNRSLRIIFGMVLFSVGSIAIFFVIRTITTLELSAQFSSDRLLQTVQQQQGAYSTATGSNFDIGLAGAGPLKVIQLMPVGIVATFFRPFIWEVSNPLMFISALEAFGFLLITLMALGKIGVGTFFKIAFSRPELIFCLIFSLTFGALVALSTSNFGALVRYKIPCLPFYLALFFIVMHRSGKFSDQYVFSRRFF